MKNDIVNGKYEFNTQNNNAQHLLSYYNALCKKQENQEPNIIINNNISYTLPPQLDIFSNIPEEAYADKRINRFLYFLKHQVNQLSNRELFLSKLHYSKEEDGSYSLEWIFKNFRAYFSFEVDGTANYGFLAKKENGIGLTSDCDIMFENDYENVAYLTVNFILTQQKG